ncbi:MAG TPA: recombinase family protein [Chloroflexota bacterium]|nr:recombinase family protein [Chloroflexota bacterium]
MSDTAPRRAIGIVRVSQVNGREGDRFISPDEQRDRIVSTCQANGLQLIGVHSEMDVSAGNPIERRPGLRAALAAIEARQADTVVVAYFDRLFRNLRVQAEVVERVEAAGGSVLTADVGEVRANTAGSRLSSTLLGAVAEYQRLVTRERTNEARRRAIARGTPATATILPGYRKTADRRLVVDEDEAAVVRQAFELRAADGSWRTVRDFLSEHGIVRSLGGVMKLLSSRTVLGELRHGEYVNENSHPAIVSREIWERVQRRGHDPRGPKSTRLLAHVGGILRCGSCGGHLSASVEYPRKRRYETYRCAGLVRRCSYRVAIAGKVLDQAVKVEACRVLALAEEKRTASTSVELEEAKRVVEQCQETLNRHIEALDDLGDVPTAKRKLAEDRRQLEEARVRVDELERLARVTWTAYAAADWDTPGAMTLDDRRALIKAVIRRVIVHPGRGPERIEIETVELLG